ncbi:MAG: hypothetical protein WD176_00695 [Pirellulales bacterium]
MLLTRPLRFVWLLFAASVLCGCSDRPQLVPVSGKVLIDGQPLTYGTIMVIPANDRPALGRIGRDGSFVLSCFDDNDGSVLGTHKVTVSAVETLNSSSQKWHAPKVYTEPATSGLEVTISEPTDSLVIELSWRGGKPFVENAAGDEVSGQ